MVKNLFEDMAVYDKEEKSVTIVQERLTKKETRVQDSRLRQAYGDKVQKPNESNQFGSKTYKSDKTDKRPHQMKMARGKHTQTGSLKKGEQAAEMEVEVNDQNGMEIEDQSTQAPQEPLVTLDEYYKQQGVQIQQA